MTVVGIVILGFVGVIVVLAFAYSGSTLEKLELEPGESVLFEESGLLVEQQSVSRPTRFFNCVVRVTSRRIIVAQKLPMRSIHSLRLVLDYSGTYHEQPSLMDAVQKGYLMAGVPKSSIHLDLEGDDPTVSVSLGTVVMGDEKMKIFTKDPDAWRQAFA